MVRYSWGYTSNYNLVHTSAFTLPDTKSIASPFAARLADAPYYVHLHLMRMYLIYNYSMSNIQTNTISKYMSNILSLNYITLI